MDAKKFSSVCAMLAKLFGWLSAAVVGGFLANGCACLPIFNF